MDIVTNALVLRSVDYRDSDCVLTLFTENMGILTATAWGCRNRNSVLAAGCQLLCWSEMVLTKQKNLDRYKVKSATSLRDFRGIRKDLEKLALGCYFAEVMTHMNPEGNREPDLLYLTLNCLHALDRMDRPLEQVKASFELRALCLSGFEPMLAGCSICGRKDPEKIRFHPREGHFCCAGCEPARPDSITLDNEVLTCLRYIAWCEPKRILYFPITGVPLRRLSQTVESFFLTQMQRGFRSLDYFHEVYLEEPPE